MTAKAAVPGAVTAGKTAFIPPPTALLTAGTVFSTNNTVFSGLRPFYAPLRPPAAANTARIRPATAASANNIAGYVDNAAGMGFIPPAIVKGCPI